VYQLGFHWMESHEINGDLEPKYQAFYMKT